MSWMPHPSSAYYLFVVARKSGRAVFFDVPAPGYQQAARQGEERQ